MSTKRSNVSQKLITVSLLLLSILISSCKQKSNQTELPIIAISQIVPHHSLDQERQGIIEGLKQAGYVDGKNIEILYENGKGCLNTSVMIANKMAAKHPAVLVGISTPSAQSLKSH